MVTQLEKIKSSYDFFLLTQTGTVEQVKKKKTYL